MPEVVNEKFAPRPEGDKNPNRVDILKDVARNENIRTNYSDTYQNVRKELEEAGIKFDEKGVPVDEGWENSMKIAKELDEPDEYKRAIGVAEEARKKAMEEGKIVQYRRIKAAIEAMRLKAGIGSETGQPTAPGVEPVAADKAVEKEKLESDPKVWLEAIKSGSADPQHKAHELSRLLDRYGGNPEFVELFTEASSLLDKYAGKESRREFEVGDYDRARIREAMIKFVNNSLDYRSDPEGTYKAFVGEQLRAMNKWTGRFEDSYEKKLHAEFLARAELAIVTNFWDDLATKYSPETDVFKEMTASKIESCRLLSRETYLWFAGYDEAEQGKFEKKGRKLDYLVNDSVDPNKRELVDEMDQALKIIKEEIGFGRLSLWSTGDSDRALYLRTLASTLSASDDAVSLAWQVAVSECWDAKNKPAIICHPLIRLARYSDTRIFKFSKKQPVPGGLRLLIEAMAKEEAKEEGSALRPGENPAEKYKSVFEREGVSLMRVGYEQLSYKDKSGKDVTGEDELDKENYLKRIGVLYSEQVEGVDKLSGAYKLTKDKLPQALLMLEITKGAEVYNAAEAIGKTDVKQLGKKELTTLRDKMVSLYFRQMGGERGGSDEIYAKAQAMAGVVTAEWAKTILWLPSRVNPANSNQDAAIPAENWVGMFRDIVTDFDGKTQFPFIQEINSEQIDRLYQGSRKEKDPKEENGGIEKNNALIDLLKLVGDIEKDVKQYFDNEPKEGILGDKKEEANRKNKLRKEILDRTRNLSRGAIEAEISRLKKISKEKQKEYADALDEDKYKDASGKDKYKEPTIIASIDDMVYTKRAPFKGYGLCIGFGQPNEVARGMAIGYVKYMEKLVRETEDFLGDKKRSAGLSDEKKKEEQRGLSSFDASYWGNWTSFYGRRISLPAVKKTDRRWWIRES